MVLCRRRSLTIRSGEVIQAESGDSTMDKALKAVLVPKNLHKFSLDALEKYAKEHPDAFMFFGFRSHRTSLGKY